MNKQTHRTRIVDWLRSNPGRHTTKEIGDATGIRHSSASAACSVLYTDATAHGGAGVYGFRNTDSPTATLYAWCSSRPRDIDLKPRLRTARPVRQTQPDNTITLTLSPIVPDVWVNGDQAYRLVPVKVTVTVTEVTA